MNDRFFDSAGVPIRYVERGSGKPVVLAHSYTGSFERDFVRSGLFDALASHHRVIGFDLRGHGASGKPHDPPHYGREMGLDIVRLLDHLQIARAHVIGYSLGAHIVAQLLTLHPERFITAVLGGACGRRHWSDADDRRVESEAAELDRNEMHAQILRLWPTGVPATDAAIRGRAQACLAGNDCRALAAVRRSNRDQLVTNAQLAAVSVPVLGIVGSADPYVASFRELARAMPSLNLQIIEGATHNTAAQSPAFVAAVQAFLEAHP